MSWWCWITNIETHAYVSRHESFASAFKRVNDCSVLFRHNWYWKPFKYYMKADSNRYKPATIEFNVIKSYLFWWIGLCFNYGSGFRLKMCDWFKCVVGVYRIESGGLDDSEVITDVKDQFLCRAHYARGILHYETTKSHKVAIRFSGLGRLVVNATDHSQWRYVNTGYIGIKSSYI